MRLNESVETPENVNQVEFLTQTTVKQIFSYLIVGGCASLVEWGAFYLFASLDHINYLLATTFAFCISTFANWLLGKILMFKTQENLLRELLKIYLTSLIGLALNLLLMWIFVQKIGLIKMGAKILATGIVFGWNFLIRKLVIYKV